MRSLKLQFSTSFALRVPNDRFIHSSINKRSKQALDQHGSQPNDDWGIEATKVI